MKKIQPVIKWSGSKRSQAEEIIKYFPKEINTYYEPFCGGCSVLMALLNNDNYKINRYICSDINQTLIDSFHLIQDSPYITFKHYELLWNELKSRETIKEKQEFYNEVRDRFNKEKNVLDFMFLNRTCFNGLIRYNSKGEFNTPFHLNRDGINPSKYKNIIQEWASKLRIYNVEFKCCSFEEINPSENDFVYLDPPYANTNGMYSGGFDNNKLFKWIRELKCKYALSYDGISGNEDNTFEVPQDTYSEKKLIKSGNSSFKRIVQVDNDAMVYESLYLN